MYIYVILQFQQFMVLLVLKELVLIQILKMHKHIIFYAISYLLIIQLIQLW